MRLALIYGGQGCESEVSISGFRYVFPILCKNFDILPIFIDKSGEWIYKNRRVFPTEGGFYCMENRILYPADSALPLLHGDYGEDGVIQSALTVARIPYVGCDGRVGAICRNKSLVKAVAERLGIPTLPHRLLTPGERPPLPCFIKPTSLGSSIGAGAARSESELEDALDKAFSLSNQVMAEPLLTDKRELECGFFSAKGKELFTNAGEILVNGSFYDYKSKYEGHTKTRVVADILPEVNRRIKEYSARLVRHLGVRQISRIDFFLSGEELYFNEINTLPGFTSDSLYPRMLSAAGIDTEKLLCDLVEDCL